MSDSNIQAGYAEIRRLARGPEGEAITTQDQSGVQRYLYENGSLDPRSQVDHRNPVIEVAGCIAIESVTAYDALPEAEMVS